MCLSLDCVAQNPHNQTVLRPTERDLPSMLKWYELLMDDAYETECNDTQYGNWTEHELPVQRLHHHEHGEALCLASLYLALFSCATRFFRSGIVLAIGKTKSPQPGVSLAPSTLTATLLARTSSCEVPDTCLSPPDHSSLCLVPSYALCIWTILIYCYSSPPPGKTSCPATSERCPSYRPSFSCGVLARFHSGLRFCDAAAMS
jgi:hypothetical protein